MIKKDPLQELDAVMRRAGTVDKQALALVRAELLLLRIRVAELENDDGRTARTDRTFG